MLVRDVISVVVLGEDFIGMLEMQHEVHADLGVGFMKSVKHLEQRAIEALRVKRHLLGADADGLDPGFGQRGKPCGELRVAEDQSIPARKQDLAKLLSSAFGMTPTVGFDGGVVLMNIRDDLGNLRQSLLGHGSILALDLFAGDEFFAVAETAMGRARRDDVHQPHLVLVEQPFDRSIVHLEPGIFGALEVVGFVRARFNDAGHRFGFLGHFVIVPRHLHRHALLDIALGPMEDPQRTHLVFGVEVQHVFRGPLIEERREPIDDLALVLGVLNSVEERLLAGRGDVLKLLDHQNTPGRNRFGLDASVT
jgi:hypothetical protein